MTDALIVFGLFLGTTAASELLIANRLQSAFGRIVTAHAVGLALALALVRRVEPGAVVVFWIGMSTVWFGMRSHLESSILLQVLAALRDGPSARSAILARCLHDYGPEARAGELVRGGFLQATSHGLEPTRKGRLVARIAPLLR